jgi:hypothetical protein
MMSGKGDEGSMRGTSSQVPHWRPVLPTYLLKEKNRVANPEKKEKEEVG